MIFFAKRKCVPTESKKLLIGIECMKRILSMFRKNGFYLRVCNEAQKVLVSCSFDFCIDFFFESCAWKALSYIDSSAIKLELLLLS